MKNFLRIVFLMIAIVAFILLLQPHPMGRHLAGDFHEQLLSSLHDVMKDIVHPQHLFSKWGA